MTRMSDPTHGRPADHAAKSAGSLRRCRVARGVHRPQRAVPALLFALLAGCIIPPSLSVDNQDAGTNSPPAITSIRSDQVQLPEPGPVTFAQGTGTINVELVDADVKDELFVRVFFNYEIGNPTAPRAQCTAPSTGELVRTVNCDLGALCLVDDIPPRQLYEYHGMQVQVFDREPAETGTPRFKAMPEGEGGLTTSWFFYLDCVERSS